MNNYRFLASLVFLVASGSLCKADPLEAIRVSDDGTHFVAGPMASHFRPMGFNYDHDASGRLIEDYWHAEWDRVEDDFRDMRKLGANVVRVHLQFGRFMKSATEPNEAELKQLTRLLELAEDTRLYLDLTGLGCYHKKDVPEWYDLLGEQSRWNAQQVFWESIAAVCKNSSAVFCYDLMNEPVIGCEVPAKEWLGPAFGDKHFVQFVARSTNGRTRPQAARQWIDQLVKAVRKHDETHLITIGFVDWSLERPGLTSGFVPHQVAENLDFLAVHIYPKAGKVTEALETLKGFQIGKPVIIEETFPLGCSMEELESFMNESGDAADGFVSFFWGKLPDEYEPSTTIADAVTSRWLQQFSSRMKATPAVAVAQKEPAEVVSGVVKEFVQHSKVHADGHAAFSIDLSAWSVETRNLPIGVFDSGIGGLTVQDAIYSLDAFNNDDFSPRPDGRKDFQHERFIYFGDQANMPYGNYPASKREEFLKELILKDAAFLLGRRYWPKSDASEPKFNKPPVKAIVIACNTATAWGLEEIRQAIGAWQIPVFVIGVVEAGARGVTDTIDVKPADGQRRTVAVLATVGTCGSNAYPKAIGKATGLAGKQVPHVVQQGSVGLAGAIEGDPGFIVGDSTNVNSDRVYLGPSVEHKTAKLEIDWLSAYGFDQKGLLNQSDSKSLRLNSVANYVRYDVTTLVKNYKDSGKTAAIDTVVLGCTHFPLVRQEILAEFARLREFQEDGQHPFRELIAESITVVDPAELTAKELFREIARRKLFRKADENSASIRDQYFISVANPHCTEAKRLADGSLDRDYKYGRHPGRLSLEDTICVPMETPLLPRSTIHLIQTKLPEVWNRLSSTSAR